MVLIFFPASCARRELSSTVKVCVRVGARNK